MAGNENLLTLTFPCHVKRMLAKTVAVNSYIQLHVILGSYNELRTL